MSKKILITTFIITALIVLSGFYVNLNNESKKIEDQIDDIEKSVENLDIDITSISKNNETLYQALEKIGIKKAMEKLIKESGGGSVYDCHQEAHQIGRIGYKVEKEKAFQECDGSCHSGCYHGAMESFLNEKGLENLAVDIDRICKKFETSFGHFECLHGVGHGVLAYLDYDLPQAIHECKKLPDSFSQSSCYGGMFMENILTGQGLGAGDISEDGDIHSTDWVNRKDPYFPCNKIDKNNILQYQCYQMQTSWMLTLANYNFDTVMKQCLNAPDNMQHACFISFGRDAAGFTLRNPQKIMSICSKVPEENNYYNNCISGALNVIIDFWGPSLGNQASELCSIIPSKLNKKNCYQIIANRLPGLFKDTNQQKKICLTFEAEYQNLCG